MLPRLYQGPVPASAEAVKAAGFTLLVLCAEEIQPPVPAFLPVLRCPLRDDPTVALPEPDWQRALACGAEVANQIRRGNRALVTCQAGLNRSGLVMAIALHRLTGAGGAEAVAHIRKHRGSNALCNPQFVNRLLTLQAARQ